MLEKIIICITNKGIYSKYPSRQFTKAKPKAKLNCI